MEVAPAAVRQASVGCVAQYWAPEAENAGTVGFQESAQQRSGALVDLGKVVSDQLSQHVAAERRAQHGGVPQQPPGLGREGVDACGGNGVEGVRQVFEVAVVADRTEQLGTEQRIAVHSFDDLVHFVRMERIVVRRGDDHRPGGVVGELAEVVALHLGVGGSGRPRRRHDQPATFCRRDPELLEQVA